MPDYMQGFYDSLSQGVQVAQHLRSAAQQQQQLDEQKRANRMNEEIAGRHAAVAEAAQRERQAQEEFANRLALLQGGARPVSSGANGNAYDESAGGLVPGAVGVTQGMTQPVDRGRVVGSGGQRFYVPTLDEQFKEQLGREVTKAGALEKDKLDNYGVTVPDTIATEFKMKPGTRVLLDHAKALADLHEALHPKPVAAPTLHFQTNDRGDVTGLHPQTGAVVSVQKGVGQTEAAKHPPATPRPARVATPGQFSQVEKDKGAELEKSSAQLKKDLAAVDKAYKADSEYDRVGGIKQAYADHAGRQKQAQLTYEGRLGALTGSEISHNSWADEPAGDAAQSSGASATPPAQTPASPGGGRTPSATPGAPTQAKTATLDDVKAYAAKYKLSTADAIRSVQKQGYKVAGQ